MIEFPEEPTPAMIQAGGDVVWDAHEWDRGEFDLNPDTTDLATEVYKAMRQAYDEERGD